MTRSTYVITPGTKVVRTTDELSTAVDEARADLGIADGGVSLRQGRFLEDQVGVRDVDRTALILGPRRARPQ